MRLDDFLRDAERPFLLGDGGLLTWGEAVAEVARRAAVLRAGLAVAVTAPGREGLLDLFAAAWAGAVPLLGRAEDLSLDPGSSGVVLFTSGTSGQPKAALHRWETLLGRVHRAEALADSRWLLAYPFTAFAGLQVVLTAVVNGATLVLASGDPAQRLRVSAEVGATHLSGTPTFFRLGLMGDFGDWQPRQLTLGGEVVDQPVLDALRARFPAARMTHIYASTEMGACFSVHDGRAGFPVAWLESDGLPVQLRVVDGELQVKSPFAMRGYVGQAALDDGWYATGDRVEVVGDRVLFTGRAGERINVGGRKVAPARVEAEVLRVPGVLAVRVSGRPNPLAGQTVQAHVVPGPGVVEAALRLAILEHCQKTLESHEVPRTIRFVAGLEQTATGKIVRG